MSLVEDYEKHDAGRELKVCKERVKAHVQQIQISLDAIRAIKSKYAESSNEVNTIVNELKDLVSAIY